MQLNEYRDWFQTYLPAIDSLLRTCDFEDQMTNGTNGHGAFWVTEDMAFDGLIRLASMGHFTCECIVGVVVTFLEVLCVI